MRLSMIRPLPIALVSSFDIALLAPYQSVSVSYLSFLKGILFFFSFLQFWAFAYFIPSIWNDLFLSIFLLSHCPPGIPTHSSRYTSVIFPMKTALHSCLGCCFLFCTVTVISIALHYDSNHHWTADVYFYVLLSDFELLEGRDKFLYFFNLKEYLNIIYFIKKNEVTAYI